MISRSFFAIALFLLLGTAMACSRVDTTIPGDSLDQGSKTGTHEDWGAYALKFDPDKAETEIIFDREAAIHVDVTGYLYPPACGGSGCIKASLVHWDPVNYVADFDVTIINPTPWAPSDVRMIFYNLGGKKIVNPDSFTRAYVGSISPFIAYAKPTVNRVFPGNGTVTEKVSIYWPSGSSFFIFFKVTAWLWINCMDPYEINNMFQNGIITPTSGSSIIGCDVWDWQNDVRSVTVDTTPITGGITTLYNSSGNTWDALIVNSMGAPPGLYPSLITASSPNPQNLDLYNFIKIKVSDIGWNHDVSWQLPIEPCTLDFGIAPSFGLMGYAFVAGYDTSSECNSIWIYPGWGTFPFLYATLVGLDPTNDSFKPYPPVRIDAAADYSFGWTNSNPEPWINTPWLTNSQTYCNMDGRPGFIYTPESDDHRHYLRIQDGPALKPIDCCDTSEAYQCALYGSDSPTVPYVGFQGLPGKPGYNYTDMDMIWEAIFPSTLVGPGPGKIDPWDTVAIDAQMLVDSRSLFVYILERNQAEVEVFAITDTGPGPFDMVQHWLSFPLRDPTGAPLDGVDCELLPPNPYYLPAPNTPILCVAIYNNVLPPPSWGGYINIYNSLDGTFIEQIGDSIEPSLLHEPAFLDTDDSSYEIHVMQKGAYVDMFKYY